MLHNTGTADTAALTIDGAQPVWMTLNEARQRAFTGEVVFEADPEVLAYLDNGTVYYAERASDLSLGRRLVDAGVIDLAQLERGTVRVGDIEHLGRLFDRDASVDRDAVVVLAETSTEALIAELANRAITTVRVTAYRHHPSGVHRWFVAPLDAPAVSRPVSAVAQLDTAVVDDLPGLSFAGVDTDELTIEWDDQIGETDHIASNGGFDASLRTVADQPSVHTAPGFDAPVFELSLDLDGTPDEPTVEQVDVATVDETSVTEMVADVDDTATADDLAGFEFSVVWPDGSAEPASADTVDPVAPMNVIEPTPVDDLAAPRAGEALSFTQSDDGSLHFQMPLLMLGDEPEFADAEVPDDVAEAVRRAIAAIESASVAPPEVAPQPEVTTRWPAIAEVASIDEFELTPVADTFEMAPAAGPGAFAPPTMATSAEVMYAQLLDDGPSASTEAVAEAAAAAAAEPAAMPTLAERSPANGVATVVFIDEPVEEESGDIDDRSSALRRLIGGLRRKDH